MIIAFLLQRQIPYIVRKSQKAKKQRIIISHSGIEIVIPSKARAKVSENFVAEHEEWIVKNWQKRRTINHEYDMPSEFKNNCNIPYQGKLYKLQISREDIIIPKIDFLDFFSIQFPHHFKTEIYELEIKKLYQKFLKQELQNKSEIYLKKLTSETGILVNNLKIRTQQTRWGSCSSKGNINLNFNLIFAQREVLEYVIIHEFCHLKHPNHSPEFWQMVHSLCPNYKAHKKWLTTNQHIINFATRL